MSSKLATPFALSLLLTTITIFASPLPRATPESQGIPSSAILNFIESANRDLDALHSFMLVRHSQIVAEGWWTPYRANLPHELYSLSKSFTSTAVGLAVAEGRLSIDDTVVSFFPNDAPAEPSNNLKAMRVRDLLCMSTGHEKEPPTSPADVSTRSFLAHPVPFKPGTHFLYNTAATFIQSAIVQKVTGQTVRDYLKPRLFDPLGIASPTWNTNFEGISLGGYGLSVRTEDIARFGQLYLQKGLWNGSQLIPASWVQAATARQTSNGSNPHSDWDQGYGYQFWRCRNDAYRGDGAFGQYCIVLPDHDAVIAITSGLRDMQPVLNLIWEKLLPAMHPNALPSDQPNLQKLQQTLTNLTLRSPSGTPTSPLLSRIAANSFILPANAQHLNSIALEPAPDENGTVLILTADGTPQRIHCGYRQWIDTRFSMGAYQDRPVAATGAWTADDHFIGKLCLVETPFVITLDLQFAGQQVTMNSEFNVGFGPTKQPQLIGRLPSQ